MFQVLREELCQTLSDLTKKTTDNALLDEATDLVKMASKDFKVWKGGLDAAYNKFLATHSNNLTDVILSIL
jgi:hypothetical protein